jgi:2-phosphosulfolactate phosphatase
MRVIRRTGIAGAGVASGTTVVIDTFRAFTTAAVLLDRGARRIVLTANLDDALERATRLGALLCGEERGIRPEGFDLGNSPTEVSDSPLVAGRTIVQRTTAGTRSVVAALEGGAGPVFAASLVVATATARAVADASTVTIVSAGLHGTGPAYEDDRTGDLIEATLVGTPDPELVSADVATCDRADTLRRSPWSGPLDIEIATDVDRFAFAMEAVRRPDGSAELIRHPRDRSR